MVAETNTDTAAELERLRAENAALKEQVAVAEKVSSTRSMKLRNSGAAVVMIVAALALALAIPAVWVNRMVTSTDYYVATVAPLADDPAIQDAVATAASDKIIEQLDFQTKLESRLPTDLAFLAAPISNAADNFVRKQATNFVQSDAFAKVWEEINRVSHTAFVSAVTGKTTGALQLEAGTITLDLGVLVDKIVEQLDSMGLEFVNNVPTDALDQTLTLYHSDTLAQASSAVDMIQKIALILPLIGLILAAAAVALAADRRYVLLWLGWMMLVFTIVPLEAIYIGQTYFGAQLQSLASIPSEAAQNAFGIIFAALIATEKLFAVVAVLLIAGALVAGPSKWARALRGGLAGGISGVSSHLEFGVFGRWVGARMSALRLAGYLIAAALLVVLPTPRTMTQIWWLVAFIVVWVLAVQLVGSGSAPHEEKPEAPVDGDPPAMES